MEKKGSRSVQPLQKGVGTDSKKSQDANKPWPRGCRRREPNGGTFSKNETSRKPIPQRNKTVDKRPRPRGYYYSGAVGGTEDSGLVEEKAELGSVFLQGSKKQSLNHLLNFHFEARETRGNADVGYRWNSAVKHKYNKEQFLQANCQFIVRDSGDYKQYMNNPDALVNWDLIEQVNIHMFEFPSCPICLYPPVAAKMTRCGHIYCWSCILHYLALSDKACRKCPICYESVLKNDLKSVITIPHGILQTNNIITFKLMKRLRGSLIAQPVNLELLDHNNPFSVSHKFATDVYSKLLLANKDEVNSIIERERSELLNQLAEDESCPEKCFVEEALALLNERSQSSIRIIDENLIMFDIQSNSRERLVSISTSSICGEDGDIFSVDDLDSLTTSCNKPLAKYFYFYQASDGQHIYMHNLNIRMLEHTYGSLELCPQTITGSILEKESGSVTEDLRKRQRYLQHLPVTCHFELAEIQLKPPIVKPETLDLFREQIEMRHRRRQRRNREEKRREKRIIEEENKKMGKYIEANIELGSQHQFPDFQTAALLLEEAQHSFDTELSSSPSSAKTDPPLMGSFSDKESSVSFAKMLSSSNNTAPVWPVRKITGTAPITKSAKVEEDETYVAPIHNQSFGDVIALALEKASLNDGGKYVLFIINFRTPFVNCNICKS
ncbi:hypothetical protein FQA39_LY14399 [Lamprigera yunnana]|nr:hypothetical protein FQA39_LY14399 [Lamprigera yunnana]